MTSTLLHITGSLLIVHAAYSCLHYRSLLTDLIESGQLLEIHDHPLPPADVWMEAILGFGIVFLGELIRPGSSLHPVTGRKQPLVAPAYRTRDFDIYTTRGSAL
jgi:hypothetical protein